MLPDTRNELLISAHRCCGEAVHRHANRSDKNKLSYQQWLQARTHVLKTQLGDQEKALLVREYFAQKPMDLSLTKPVANQKEIETTFKCFNGGSEIQNLFDTNAVSFPASTAGKIIQHKGFDVRLIVAAFDKLFSEALPMFSESKVIKPGHKVHTNVKAYHHYVASFTYREDDYFIRFTAHETKTRQPTKRRGKIFIHSTFVSKTEAYKKGASAVWGRFSNPVMAWQSAPFRNSLAPQLEESNMNQTQHRSANRGANTTAD